MSETATILDQPWQLYLFRLLQLKHCLQLEIRTGMRHSRGSVLKATNATLGTTFRTKAKALEGLNLYIQGYEKGINILRHTEEDPA